MHMLDVHVVTGPDVPTPRTTESVPLNVAFFLSFGIGKEGKPSGTDPLLLLFFHFPMHCMCLTVGMSVMFKTPGLVL